MDCKTSALCLFDKKGVLSDIRRSYVVDYYPVSSLTSDGPIEILIPGSSEDYINCGNTKLYLRFKVVNEDGSDVDQSTEILGLNNLPIASLFSNASLHVGETQIEGGGSDYPYRAYLQTVMQFPPAAQESTMRAMGWYKDEAGKFDDKANKGFVQRQQLVGNSKTIELVGPLYFDFFNQDRYLLSLTNMRIKLTPNRPEFFLSSFKSAPGKYKVEFELVKLSVERNEMNPSVINGHAIGLKTQNAQYYVNHTHFETFTVPKGQSSVTKDNIFTDISPKMVIVGMLDNDAFNGSYQKNPFHFKHYNLTKFAFFRDGRSIPGQPYEPDFKQKLYLESYIQTMQAFNYWNTDDTNGLKPNDWANGYTFFAFDLTPDKEASSGCQHANVSGNLRLDLAWAADLPNTINVVLHAITDSVVEITRSRDAIPHYNR